MNIRISAYICPAYPNSIGCLVRMLVCDPTHSCGLLLLLAGCLCSRRGCNKFEQVIFERYAARQPRAHVRALVRAGRLSHSGVGARVGWRRREGRENEWRKGSANSVQVACHPIGPGGWEGPMTRECKSIQWQFEFQSRYLINV